MSKLIVAVFVTAALSLGGCATQRDARTAIAQPGGPPVPISKEAYDTALLAENIATEKYRAGSATLLELTTARLARMDYELQLVRHDQKTK